MRDQDVFLERALQREGFVSAERLEEVRRHARSNDVDLVDALTATETLTARDIALVKADLCETPYVNLADYEPNLENTRLVPRTLAEHHRVFPLFVLDDVLTLAMDDPLDLEAADQIRRVTRREVDVVLAEREQLRLLISRAYSLTSFGSEKEVGGPTVGDEAESNASEPVVAAVNELLADAIEHRASDVHLNPDEHELRIRLRVDGVLHERQGPPLSMHPALVQRLKVMAHLDLTQTRRPQDGKFRFRHGNQCIDVRLSTLPTVGGENVVMRLLAQNQSVLDFQDLGMHAAQIEAMERMLSRPYGMLLSTGPTGSGKTTSLYAALNRLNDPSRNIMTIEDPVEIRLPYVRQIQVNHEINLTFATALRSILRQDPDVVLVGEIRDGETASIALQAALTGHLVLSTLHTNDAAGSVDRLRDYGLPPFVINSAVLGVLAQRLVRQNCSYCAAPYTPDELLRSHFKLDDADMTTFKAGRGCSRCRQTGYRGRVGLFEMLEFQPAVQRVIERGGSVQQMREQAMQAGMRLLWQDGLHKVQLGRTTLEEVARVASVTYIADESEGVQPGSPDAESDASDGMRRSA